MMYYLSQLLNAPVESQQDERIGKIVDVLVPMTDGGAVVYPSVFLVEGEDDQPWRVPLATLERREQTWHLLAPVGDLTQQPQVSLQPEISLASEVLDKEVIDLTRKKAVRVNDICFDENWQLLGIDSSPAGLLRRLAPAWLLGKRGQQALPQLVPWTQIEIIESEQRERPRLPRSQSGQLAELHPADIAEIVHQLTPGEGARLIEGFDNKTAADTMEEIDTERQRHILENIQPERAADILEAMEPDEAADLLGRLSEEQATQLLRLMQPEESEDVQELLEYEDNTAGGLMTTAYIVLDQTRTVAEALADVRTNIAENDVYSTYVYCVADESADESNILGVVSLWELLIANPEQPLSDLMETDVITVQLDTDPREVAEIMAKYNLLAVPVVNEAGLMQGIVTVDDALDVLLPNERRRRPKRMY